MEITEEELKLMNLFESVTGVMPSDIIVMDEGTVFLVDPPILGKAIGKKGNNVQRLKQRMNRNVLVSKNASEPEEFLRGFFNNIEVLSFEIREAPGQKVAFLTVPDSQRGIAIGKSGLRIKAAKKFLKKKFGVDLSLRTRRTG